MKILIFNQYFWPENFYINQIALGLNELGHAVEVLTGQPTYPNKELYSHYNSFSFKKESWNGILINRFPVFPRKKKSTLGLVLTYLTYILSASLFGPLLLRKKKFDVVFVYAPSPIFQVIPSLFLAWLKGIPIVLWVQDLWPESIVATGHIQSPFIQRITKLLVKFCYSKVDLILVQSRAFIEPISIFEPKAKVIYYPNSVDKSFYSPDILTDLSIDSLRDGFNVVFAGNIGIAQSMETILSGAQKLSPYPEIKIVILGSGSQVDWVSQEIKNRDLRNVYLEGAYPLEAMPVLLRKASVLLVSLTGQYIFSLTIPNKIQAYLAVGKPIIASLNGEGAKVVKEAGAGLVAPAEDAEKLAEAILKMYHLSDDERSKMGENGRTFFKNNFDEDRLLRQLVNLFDELIVKRKK